MNGNRQTKKSQILLITIIFVSIIMTVVFSISFQSITETQMTKLEEENKKALSAAESAIEALLNQKTNQVFFGSGELSNFSDFSGGAIVETNQSNEFTSPFLKKDSSYTFYIAPYDINNNSFGPSINSNLEICFSSSQALEITLIGENKIRKYAVDPTRKINNATNPSNICSNNSYQRSFTITASDISTNSSLLVIKNLFADGKIFFKSNVNLPPQGKTISSRAVNNKTKVSKRIIFFQSYPQIPADFFYTRF